MRIEFGAKRTVCGCETCVTNCRFMPGYLIPADLDRMIPKDADVYEWAEQNLLASPGAKVIRKGRVIDIHTLVPATKRDGSCIYLSSDDRCNIHVVSPFGCAFFDCKTYDPKLSALGLQECMRDEVYQRIWKHLPKKGLVTPTVQEKRDRMNAALRGGY